MTKYYKVLAGTASEYADDFINNEYFGIHYDIDVDLSRFSKDNYEDFRSQLISANPSWSRIVNKLWRVYSEFKIGDMVILYIKDEHAFKVGVIESEYIYKEGIFCHQRKIDWHKYPSILKEDMSQGLQNSATGPTAIANLEKRTGELEHLIFGYDWTPELEKEELALDEEAEELASAIEHETTKHHVYVYTYNHYVIHPVREQDADTPISRTYYKIGVTTQGYKNRIDNQETTAFPEPIMIVRAYKLSDEEEMLSTFEKDKKIREKESTFHALLEAAGHTYSKQKKKQGKEWFLTNISLLDNLAEMLGMQQIELDDFRANPKI